MKKRIRQYVCASAALIGGILLLTGCVKITGNTEKIQDLEYTVLSPEEYPAEVTEVMEEKKEKGYRITYADQGYLYICVGYGTQETGGYSITVKELYETDNGIYVDTTLIGPAVGEEISEGVSYPSLVLKLEDIGKSVIFN